VTIVLANDPTRPIRTFISTLGAIVGLGAGTSHTCAVASDGNVFCWGLNASGQVGDGSTLNRVFATPVPSFSFNVDRIVQTRGRGHVAVVTALVNCPAGQHVKVDVRLTQGVTTGHGQAAGQCTGGLEGVPVKVAGHRGAVFQPGPAEAEADAVVPDRGQIVDTHDWTRAVELTVEP